jgi:hypothetical protein
MLCIVIWVSMLTRHEMHSAPMPIADIPGALVEINSDPTKLIPWSTCEGSKAYIKFIGNSSEKLGIKKDFELLKPNVAPKMGHY